METPTEGTGPLKGDHRGDVGELVTVGQQLCLAGMQNQFYVWNGASWLDERESLAVGREVLTGINAVVAMGELPAVAILGRVHVRDGGDWRPLPLSLTEELHALAYRASDGALFAAGTSLWRVSREGECQALPLSAKTTWWGAAVFREQLDRRSSRWRASPW
ncbi:hypothetical protein A176_001003 [Myxococcus hansupus]|uniref:Uncharacterized protein n=1 Tax=Pseudomyxococcus hansupus TaxID=1297742 RepID=A0A0H4WL44_9BACT|nr:hypothetical protein [Myxococcus hansupus]AKQ64091.1 hypothetical protein A176_001003 [Myxococcus hansupus]